MQNPKFTRRRIMQFDAKSKGLWTIISFFTKSTKLHYDEKLPKHNKNEHGCRSRCSAIPKLDLLIRIR